MGHRYLFNVLRGHFELWTKTLCFFNYYFKDFLIITKWWMIYSGLKNVRDKNVKTFSIFASRFLNLNDFRQKKKKNQVSIKWEMPQGKVIIPIPCHCVKSVRIRSFSDTLYFFVFNHNRKCLPEKLRIRTLFTQCVPFNKRYYSKNNK